METQHTGLRIRWLRGATILELTKPKVIALIVFTAIVGALLATPGWPPLEPLVAGTLVSRLASAMRRCAESTCSSGTSMRAWRALRVAHCSRALVGEAGADLRDCARRGCDGDSHLPRESAHCRAYFLVSLGYAVIYTLWLKRATPQNIVIGGAAGAAPPMLGWAAMTGSVDANALALLLIIFVWTPPHFWSLAIARREEYARVENPDASSDAWCRYTSRQVLLYTVWLVLDTMLPFLTGMSGLIYLAVVAPLDVMFLLRIRSGVASP